MEITQYKKSSLKNIRGKMAERCEWIKLVNGEIQADGNSLGSCLEGTIETAEYGHVRFVDGKPERNSSLSPEEAVAQGYGQEVTLKIRANGKLYGLTVPRGSISTRFEPYVDLLLSKGLEYLFQVTTRITASYVQSAKFPYHVLSFELVEVKNECKPAA